MPKARKAALLLLQKARVVLLRLTLVMRFRAKQLAKLGLQRSLPQGERARIQPKTKRPMKASSLHFSP